MPTTIDQLSLTRALPFRGLLVVAFVWFSGMSGMALLIRPDAVVVFGPTDHLIPAIVASDGALLDAGRFHIAARTGAATVGSLYAAGAWLVWPIMGKGCGRG